LLTIRISDSGTITAQPAKQQTNKERPMKARLMNALTRSSAQAHHLKTRFLNNQSLHVALLITAFTLVSFSTMADQQLAINGTQMYVDSTPISFVFPLASNLTTDEGEASHLGHYTIIGITTIDVTTASATGTFRLVTEAGDILFLTMTGHALQPFTLKETVADLTVTGGTGRFVGATGGWHLDSHFANAVNSGVTPNPYVGQISGVISIATHGNHPVDKR
jgi:hypothetical protein